MPGTQLVTSACKVATRWICNCWVAQGGSYFHQSEIYRSEIQNGDSYLHARCQYIHWAQNRNSWDCWSWSWSTQSLPVLVSLLLLVVLLLHCSSSILGSPENKVTGHEADCVGYLACGRATWLGASWSSDRSWTSSDSTSAPGKSFSSSDGGVA